LAFDVTRESLSTGKSRTTHPRKQRSPMNNLLWPIWLEGLEDDTNPVIVSDPGTLGRRHGYDNSAACLRGITQHLGPVNEPSTSEQ
jgi:hypothetical protein